MRVLGESPKPLVQDARREYRETFTGKTIQSNHLEFHLSRGIKPIRKARPIKYVNVQARHISFMQLDPIMHVQMEVAIHLLSFPQDSMRGSTSGLPSSAL